MRDDNEFFCGADRRVTVSGRGRGDSGRVSGRRRPAPTVIAAMAALAVTAAAAASCPEWSNAIGQPGTNGVVRALLRVPSGSGSSVRAGLYGAGFFSGAGGTPVKSIARYDATLPGWVALSGINGEGLSDEVFAMAMHDGGSGPVLHVGGSFTMAGNAVANGVATWNGWQWSGVGLAELDGPVRALASHDPDGDGPQLYVGGHFQYLTHTPDPAYAHGLLRRKGGVWHPVGPPWLHGVFLDIPGEPLTAGTVHALLEHDDGSGPALYLAGQFNWAGAQLILHIARLKSGGWSTVGAPGENGVRFDPLPNHAAVVLAMATFDEGSGPVLFVGGGFNAAGNATAHGIARWDGNSWSAVVGPLGEGVSGGLVGSLTVFDDGSGPALFVGGSFSSAGGVPAARLAKWDGSEWSAVAGTLGHGVSGGWVGAMAVVDDTLNAAPSLIVGGQFTGAGGLPANNVARFDGCLPPIPGDLDGDGVVDGADLGVLLGNWGDCDDCDDCPGDLNGDCVVDGADLGILLGNWTVP